MKEFEQNAEAFAINCVISRFSFLSFTHMIIPWTALLHCVATNLCSCNINSNSNTQDLVFVVEAAVKFIFWPTENPSMLLYSLLKTEWYLTGQYPFQYWKAAGFLFNQKFIACKKILKYNEKKPKSNLKLCHTQTQVAHLDAELKTQKQELCCLSIRRQVIQLHKAFQFSPAVHNW